MVWNALNAVYDRLTKLPHVAPCLLGCSLIRAWLGLVIPSAQGIAVHLGGVTLSAHVILSLGECLGFLLAFWMVRKGGQLRTAQAALPLAAVAGLAGAIGLLALNNGNWATALLVYPVCGVAYAMGLMLWIEIYGRLPTEHAVLAWAGSYLVNLVLWMLLQDSGDGVRTLCLVAFPLLAAALLVPASRAARHSEGPCAPLKNAREGEPQATPWLLLLWVAVFGFLYGLGDSATALAFSTLPARLGMAIPVVVAVIGITWGKRSFDFKALTIMAVVGMVAGMAVVFVLGGSPRASQVFMSAANESYLMFAYAFACAVAFRTGSSAVRVGGLIGCCNIAMVQVGSVTGSTLLTFMAGNRPFEVTVGIAAAAFALGVSIAAVYNRDTLDSLVKAPEDSEEARLEQIANQLGLSPKETAVFVLLVQNRSIAQIADELFLAPGTIRAHTSNIYRKMDVHSRASFLEKAQGLMKARDKGPDARGKI